MFLVTDVTSLSKTFPLFIFQLIILESSDVRCHNHIGDKVISSVDKLAFLSTKSRHCVLIPTVRHRAVVCSRWWTAQFRCRELQ